MPEPRQVKQSAFKAPLPANPLKIFTRSDKQHYDNFLSQTDSSKMQKYSNRLRYFPSNQFLPSCEPSCSHMHNHLECNYFIGNKKALFYNLKQYYELLGKDVFTIIPLTYHIRGVGDTQFEVFVKEFKRGKMSASKNVWIVKPGELSNRGQGITVINSLNQLLAILKKK